MPEPGATLEYHRKRAKELRDAHRRGDPAALARIREHHPQLAGASDAAVRAAAFPLTAAQLVIARELGHPSWPALKRELESRRERTPLERAAQAVDAGRLEPLETLLREHPSLATARLDYGDTLLHRAAGSLAQRNPERAEIARALVRAGADVDALSEVAGSPFHACTPLHYAATLDEVPVARVLLEAGARIDFEAAGEGGTPLAQAIFYGCVQTAGLLAAREVTPRNLRVAAGLGRIDLLRDLFDDDGRPTREAGAKREFYRPHTGYPEWTPSDTPQEVLDEAFVWACRNGRAAAAAFLLDRGAHVDAMPYLEAGLHAAAWRGHRDVVELLVERGADVNQLDLHWRGVPWGFAQRGGHPELSRFLLEKSAERDLVAAARLGVPARVEERLEEAPDRGRLEAALAVAIEAGHDEIARRLRERGATTDFKTSARLGLVDEVRAYLAAGADPDEALAGASARNHTEVCKLLIAAGARVDFFRAAELGMRDRLEALLAGGQEVDAVDAEGQTALQRAVSSGAAEAVELLLERGADAARPLAGEHGPRVLHMAAWSGAEDRIFGALLAGGADLNLSANGSTALDWALNNGHEATARALRARGAKTSRELGVWGPQGVPVDSSAMTEEDGA